MPAAIRRYLALATKEVQQLRRNRVLLIQLMLPPTIVLIIFGYALFTTQFTAAVVGSILLAMPYLSVHLITPTALGAGDVKLAVGLGAVAALGGAQVWVRAALTAPVLTAAFGLVVLAQWRIRSGADRAGPHALPHGPAMCVATVLSLAAAYG